MNQFDSNVQTMAPIIFGAINMPRSVDPEKAQLQGQREAGKLKYPDPDPLAKREYIAKEQRDTKRREIWSKKKIANLEKATAQGARLLLLNVRGINSPKKQILLAKQMAKDVPAIMVLTETKLTKTMGLNGYFTNQTQKRRGGGCWIGASSRSMKPIKSFNNSLNWVRVEIRGTYIHIIGVYITPGMEEKKEHNLATLDSILSQLKNNATGRQYIVLAGDFNDAMAEVTLIAAKYGLLSQVPAGTQTHAKGGHLDQVFTNMATINVELIEVDKQLSDHRAIALTVVGERNETEIQNGSTRCNLSSQVWIRKQARKQGIIESLLKEGPSIRNPLRNLIGEQRRPHQARWYQPKPKGTSDRKKLDFTNEGAEMTKQEWMRTMKKIENLHKEGDWKEFFAQVQRITKIKQKSCFVQAVQEGDWISSNDEERDQKIAEYMEKLYDGSEYKYEQSREIDNQLFTEEEVDQAVSATNYNKGIGPDMFDGTILLQSPALRAKVVSELKQMLNQATFPEYFTEGRLTALSKKQGKTTVELEDIRPIAIRSHLTKTAEKAVLKKLEEEHKHLIKTSLSQTGFKKNSSTSVNITKFLKAIHPGRGKKKKTAVILVDLKKAYDSVDRAKLMIILKSRCRDDKDRQIVDIIASLQLGAKLKIGSHTISTKKGLAQGSVLAPLLFNVYLEEALRAMEVCGRKYRQGELACYADDIMCAIRDQHEAKKVIQELTLGLQQWGLEVNQKKSEIIGFPDINEIEGIQCKKKVRYLGMDIVLGSNNQRKAAAAQVFRNIAAIKNRLWGCNTAVKECLLNAYTRSLLVYFGPPMQASGLWSQEDVRKLEASIYRKVHGISRDIPTEVMMNVTQYTQSVTQVINKRATELRRAAERASSIPWANKNDQSTTQQKIRTRIYLPKEIAGTMMALAKGRTLVFYGKRHRCVQHGCVIDDTHLRVCELFSDLPQVQGWAKQLRQQNLREWKYEDQSAAIVSFTLLKARLNELEARGQILVIDFAQQNENLMQNQNEESKSEPNETIIVDAEKRGRGRPRKTKQQLEKGQLSIEFYIQKNQQSTRLGCKNTVQINCQKEQDNK